MADIQLTKALSDVFGPSGYEHEVAALIMNNMKDFDVQKDAMQNVYARFKNGGTTGPTVMLDSHTDEVGFMVQAIKGNGLLKLVPLGGWVDSNVPAHAVLIKTTKGNLVRGITSSKPPHFMTAAEMAKPVSLADIAIDVGVTSRQEVLDMGIDIGCAVAPEVDFSYNEKSGVMLGKAFDNRLGCLCVIEVMKKLQNETLPVNVVGTFATQEEVGCRGAIVTAQVVQPDFAIVFEGSPSDDFYFSPEETQCAMKGGAQIRYRDSAMVAHPGFIQLAREIAEKNNIKIQCTVRTGGGTNGGPIHTTGKAVPTLVLGIPVRYAHTHYCYSATEDIDAAIELGAAIIKTLNAQAIASINA